MTDSEAQANSVFNELFRIGEEHKGQLIQRGDLTVGVQTKRSLETQIPIQVDIKMTDQGSGANRVVSLGPLGILGDTITGHLEIPGLPNVDWSSLDIGKSQDASGHGSLRQTELKLTLELGSFVRDLLEGKKIDVRP